MNKSLIVSWVEACKEQVSHRGTQFLRLRSGQTYRLRPLCKPHVFTRLYHQVDGICYTAICDPGIEEIVPYDVNASKRYAYYVIDRTDKVMKVLEGPASVIKPFGVAARIQPDDSQQGSDCLIEVTGSGKMTRYWVATLDRTPLTCAEIAVIGSLNMAQSLDTIFKSQTREEIYERLKL
jgi:hypothetical protein